MKKLLLIAAILILIISCNPCKNIAKHPECFPADTVKEKEYVTRYEKIFITEDSLIYDTIPCDPITETAVNVETVYKTIYKTRIDTFHKYVNVCKINPVNTKLQDENKKLQNKLAKTKRHAKFYLILVLISIAGIAIYLYTRKLRL